MQKIFLVGLAISIFGILNAAEMSIDISEKIDISLTPYEAEIGTLHPLSRTIEELCAIFADMGFSIVDGPDIESDYYNFTALNIPEEHPARQEHDTFYLQPDINGQRKVLRTHTSPVQIRTMLKDKPPFKIIAPGRTYRRTTVWTWVNPRPETRGIMFTPIYRDQKLYIFSTASRAFTIETAHSTT